MSVNGSKGLQDLMGMLKGLKGSTLSSMLAKTKLSEDDQKAISALFEQFNQEQKLDSASQQNALAIIQKLFQQAPSEDKKAQLTTLINQLDQNAKFSEKDKIMVEELKKKLLKEG
jgi:hypothetical protein